MPHAPASSRTMAAPATSDPAVPAAPGRRATYRQVLGVGEFRAIFAANIVSMLGTVVAAVALRLALSACAGCPPPSRVPPRGAGVAAAPPGPRAAQHRNFCQRFFSP